MDKFRPVLLDPVRYILVPFHQGFSFQQPLKDSPLGFRILLISCRYRFTFAILIIRILAFVSLEPAILESSRGRHRKSETPSSDLVSVFSGPFDVIDPEASSGLKLVGVGSSKDNTMTSLSNLEDVRHLSLK